MSELELKFRLSSDVVPSLRAALQSHGASVIALNAQYFDTVGGALARRKMSLRLRQENDGLLQTFKAGGDSPVHRLEHEVWVVPSAKSGKPPTIDITRHDGHRAATLLREALGDMPVALVSRQRSEIERLVCTVTDAQGTVIEIALDVGRVTSARRSVPIAELEFEHKGGPVAGLFSLASLWVANGGLCLSTISKAARADRLRSGLVPTAVRSTPVSCPARADASTFVRAVLRSALDQVLPNASEVAEGLDDADVIHQLRIGLRRLRTALRELAPLCGAIDPSWNEALADTFSRLGEQRDRQVVVEAVQPLLSAAGIEPPPLPAPKTIAVTHAVRELAFQQALLGVLALVHGDDELSLLDEDATRRFLSLRLDKLHRRVRRDGRRFDELPLEAQHSVRKRLKRLRYLSEFSAPLWKERKVDDYLSRLKPAQDVLGRHNDVAVAMSLYLQDTRHAASALAASCLQGHLQTTDLAARQALRKVRNRHRFWSVPKD